jgi:hypothetical protein
LHPELAGKVKAGGRMHIRLVDFGVLGRPFFFKEFHNVTFPLKYKIQTSDYVSLSGLEALTRGKYFVEAIYYRFPMEDNRSLEKWEGVGGEGWGGPGRPYPLAFGQTRNIVLNKWEVPENSGMAVPVDPDEVASGWLWLSSDLISMLNPDQKITVHIIFLERAADQPRKISKLDVDLLDIAKPVRWSSKDKNLMNKKEGYIFAFARVQSRDGKMISIHGGRASKKVAIKLNVNTLRIVLHSTGPFNDAFKDPTEGVFEP